MTYIRARLEVVHHVCRAWHYSWYTSLIVFVKQLLGVKFPCSSVILTTFSCLLYTLRKNGSSMSKFHGYVAKIIKYDLP